MTDDEIRALYKRAQKYPTWNDFILSPDGDRFFDMTPLDQKAFKSQYADDLKATPEEKDKFLKTIDISPKMRQDWAMMAMADLASGTGVVGKALEWLNQKLNPKGPHEYSKAQLEALLPSYRATGEKGSEGIYSPLIHAIETPVIPKFVPLIGGANLPSLFGFNPEAGLSSIPSGGLFNLVAGGVGGAVKPIARGAAEGALNLVGKPVAESIPKSLAAKAIESSLTGGTAMAAGQSATGGEAGKGFVAGALLGPAFEAAGGALRTGKAVITGEDTPFMILKQNVEQAKAQRLAREAEPYKTATEFLKSRTVLEKAPKPQSPQQGSLPLKGTAAPATSTEPPLLSPSPQPLLQGAGETIPPASPAPPVTTTVHPDPLEVPHEAVVESVASQLNTEPSMPIQKPILPDTLSTSPKPEPVSPTNIPVLKGNKTQAILQNSPIDYEYVIAPLDNVITSHNHETFSPNKEYPQVMQQRDRSLPSYRLQVTKMANDIIPQLLADSPEVTSGAPTIADLNSTSFYVEAGNGRTMALKLLDDKGYNKYIDYIKENADKFGIKKEDIDKYQESGQRVALFRRRLTQMPAEQYAALSNYNSTMTFSEIEKVANLASMIKPDTVMKFKPVGTIEETINSPKNKEALAEIIAQLPFSELNNYQSTDGALTPAGTKRIIQGMFYKTYGERISKILFDDIDINIKKITNGLADSLPLTASVKGKILTGIIDKSIDIFPDFDQTVELFSSLRKQGIAVSDYLDQQKMFPDITNLQQSMLRALDEYSSSAKKIQTLMSSIVDAYKPYEKTSGTLQGMEIKLPTKEELWSTVTNKAAANLGESLFAAPAAPEAPKFVEEAPASKVLEIPTEEAHAKAEEDIAKVYKTLKNDYQRMKYLMENSKNRIEFDLTDPKSPQIKITNTPGRILTIKSKKGNAEIPFDDPIAKEYLETLEKAQHKHGDNVEIRDKRKTDFMVNTVKFADTITGLDSAGLAKWTTEFRKLVSNKREEYGASVLYLNQEDIEHLVKVRNNIVAQIPEELNNITNLTDLRTALITSNMNPQLVHQIDNYKADLIQRLDAAVTRYENYYYDKHEIPASVLKIMRNNGEKPEGLSEDGYNRAKDYMAAKDIPIPFDDETGAVTIDFLSKIPAYAYREFRVAQTHFHTLGFLADQMRRLKFNDVAELVDKSLDAYQRKQIADNTIRDLNKMIYYRNGKHISPVENEVIWQLLNKYANPDDVKALIGKSVSFMTREGAEVGKPFDFLITPDIYKRYAYARAFFDYAKDMQGIQTDIKAYAPHWSLGKMRYGLYDTTKKQFIDNRTFTRDEGLAEMLAHIEEYKKAGITLTPRVYDTAFDNLDPKTLLRYNKIMESKIAEVFSNPKLFGELSFSADEILANRDEIATALGYKSPKLADVKTYKGLLQSKNRAASYWIADSKAMEVYPFLMNRYLMSLEVNKLRPVLDTLRAKYKDNFYVKGVLNRVTDALNLAMDSETSSEQVARTALERMILWARKESRAVGREPTVRKVLDNMRSLGATFALGFTRMSTAFVVYSQPFVTGSASELGLKNMLYAYNEGLYNFIRGRADDPLHVYISKTIGSHTLSTDFADHFGIRDSLDKKAWGFPLFLFNKAESFARIVTGIASYKHAVDDLHMTDETQILEYMRKMNREIVHDYSEANLPTLMTGAGLRTWNLFRPFTVNLWENGMRFFNKIPQDGGKAFATYALLNFARGGLIAVQGLPVLIVALGALQAARAVNSNLDDYCQKYEKKYNIDLRDIASSLINNYYKAIKKEKEENKEMGDGDTDVAAYNLISSGLSGMIAGVNLGMHHSLSWQSVLSTIPGLDAVINEKYGTGISYVPSFVLNTARNITNLIQLFTLPDMKHDPVLERGGLLDLYKAGGMDGVLAGLLFLQNEQLAKWSPSLEGALKAWELTKPGITSQALQQKEASTPLKEILQFRTTGGIANIAKIRLIMGGGYPVNVKAVGPKDQAYGWYRVRLFMADQYETAKAKGDTKGMEKYTKLMDVAQDHLQRLYIQEATIKKQRNEQPQTLEQWLRDLQNRFIKDYNRPNREFSPGATLQSAEGE